MEFRVRRLAWEAGRVMKQHPRRVSGESLPHTSREERDASSAIGRTGLRGHS